MKSVWVLWSVLSLGLGLPNGAPGRFCRGPRVPIDAAYAQRNGAHGTAISAGMSVKVFDAAGAAVSCYEAGGTYFVSLASSSALFSGFVAKASVGSLAGKAGVQTPRAHCATHSTPDPKSGVVLQWSPDGASTTAVFSGLTFLVSQGFVAKASVGSLAGKVGVQTPQAHCATHSTPDPKSGVVLQWSPDGASTTAVFSGLTFLVSQGFVAKASVGSLAGKVGVQTPQAHCATHSTPDPKSGVVLQWSPDGASTTAVFSGLTFLVSQGFVAKASVGSLAGKVGVQTPQAHCATHSTPDPKSGVVLQWSPDGASTTAVFSGLTFLVSQGFVAKASVGSLAGKVGVQTPQAHCATHSTPDPKSGVVLQWSPDGASTTAVFSGLTFLVSQGFVAKASVGSLAGKVGVQTPQAHCATHSTPDPKSGVVLQWSPDGASTTAVFSGLTFLVSQGFVAKASVGSLAGKAGVQTPRAHCATHSTPDPKSGVVLQWSPDGASTTAVFSGLTFLVSQGFVAKASVGSLAGKAGAQTPRAHCATHSTPDPKSGVVLQWSPDGASTTAVFSGLTFLSQDLSSSYPSSAGGYSVAREASLSPCGGGGGSRVRASGSVGAAGCKQTAGWESFCGQGGGGCPGYGGKGCCC